MSVPWSEAIEAFLNYAHVERALSQNSIESYKRDLEKFGRFARQRGFSVQAFSAEQLQEYQLTELSKDLGAHSQNRHLSSIRQFFRFWVREGLLKDNPAARATAPKKPERLPEFLSLDEVEALIKASEKKPRDYAMLCTLYATGLRVSELLGLKAEDLDLSRGFLKTMGKGSKERLVPLGQKAIEALTVWLADGCHPGLEPGSSKSNCL
ncbi:MAG: tyrosine-type recombinase/integrase [Deltaproteobacteria bacterium]|nr:tyrosine-type recombinase/integrase [Deltaproteobacteria bacterium]